MEWTTVIKIDFSIWCMVYNNEILQEKLITVPSVFLFSIAQTLVQNLKSKLKVLAHVYYRHEISTGTTSFWINDTATLITSDYFYFIHFF